MENNQNKELILLEDLGMQYATETSKRKSRYGLFKCFCGIKFKTIMSADKKQYAKSCGCVGKEKRRLQTIERNTKHGLAKHELYNVWQHMLDRCNNIKSDNYSKYGGRGITVCSKWLDINKFIEDMYPSFKNGLTLDRKDNDLGYSRDNCRWASKAVQSRNQRLLQVNNKSGYRGVGWHKIANKYRVRITVDSKEIHLGLFEDPFKAAKVYDNYVIKNGLEHTRNFA